MTIRDTSISQDQAIQQDTGLRSILKSRRTNRRLQQVALVLILLIGALAMVVPFAWMFSTSLSRNANIAMPRIPRLWPPDPSLFNYKVASTNLPIVRYYLNSIIVAGITTAGYLFFSSLAGYAFAKGHFIGKTVLFIMLLATMMIPFEVRMIPLYFLMSDLHLNNTRRTDPTVHYRRFWNVSDAPIYQHHPR